MSKKYKKHDQYALLKYMHMLEEGYSAYHIEKHYGMDRKRLKLIWNQYQIIGKKAFEKKKNTSLHADIKYQAILDFEEKHIPLLEVMSKYDISKSAFDTWRRIYHSGGMEKLRKQKPRGRPPGMGRPKKKTVEQMTELERLQKENQELKTELALLKKVRALVEERNARLYEIGHKPSKD
ncbi:MAG: hypothetical protein MJZ30_14675 [Paludibacteraceae bacterium]|nr:hypothetical protein [Paludibacteraceae bacterium]